MSPADDKLCVAGTMSDYAAIVERASFNYKLIQAGTKPYWSTNSADGRYCFVSWSGDDRISAISYKTGAEVAQIPVGDHPQPDADRQRHPRLAAGPPVARPYTSSS